MNQLFNLVKKEVKELLTPASLVSVIAVCVILIVIGSVVGGQANNIDKPNPVGIIDETGSQEGTYSSSALEYLDKYYKENKLDSSEYVIKLNLSETGDRLDNILKLMEKNNLDTTVLIPKDYNTKMDDYLKDEKVDFNKQPFFEIYYNQSGTSVFSALSTVTGTNAVASMTLGVTHKIAEDHSISPELASKMLSPSGYTNTTFFNGTTQIGVEPAEITAAISSQSMFVPIIIMLIIVMIGSILISSMGNEKENKTLETLLTLPISRTTVVTGKILGCTIAGLVMGAIYMVGMYFYMNSFTSAQTGGKSLSELGLALNGFDWVIVAFFMFMAIMCALGLCMILGAFAKNYKAAQTYVAPISILAVIPMFVTMFSDYGSLPVVIQGVLFIIPFTHPMMIMNNLMLGNTALVIGGAIYLVIFAALMIYITVRLYNSDVLLTGLNKGEGNSKRRSPLAILLSRFQKN